MITKCPKCHSTNVIQTDTNRYECPYCSNVFSTQESMYNAMGNNQAKSTKSRQTASILAFIPVYGLSLHYLYLEKYIAGIISFLLAATFVPTILGFIQGYKLYKMSDEEFYAKYINNSEVFPLF